MLWRAEIYLGPEDSVSGVSRKVAVHRLVYGGKFRCLVEILAMYLCMLVLLDICLFS